MTQLDLFHRLRNGDFNHNPYSCIPMIDKSRHFRTALNSTCTEQYDDLLTDRSSNLTYISYIHTSRFMDTSAALQAFAALSQPTRLDVFRLLIKAGEAGVSAGDISAALDVRQNTMSANLGILARSGLIRSEREGRSIRYFADMDGMRALLSFLMEDCCGGCPELCQPVLDELVCA